MPISRIVKFLLLGYFLFFHALTILKSENSSANPALSLDDFAHKEDTPFFCELLFSKGETFFEEENYPQAIIYYDSSLAIARKNNFKEHIYYNLLELSRACFWQADYSQSILYNQELLNLTSVNVNTQDSLMVYQFLIEAYQNNGNLELAYKYGLTHLDIALRHNDSLSIANSYYSLAELERDQKNFREALAKANYAAIIFNQLNEIYHEGFCYDLIGEVYHKLKQYDLALQFKHKSCGLGAIEFNEYDKAFCDQTLAKTYLALGELTIATPLIFRAMETWESLNLPEEKIEAKTVLALIHAKSGQCDKANALLQSSLKKAKKLKVKPLIREIYRKLYLVNNQCGNFKQALVSHESFINLRDSINGIVTQKAIVQLEANSQLEKQKQAISLLESQKEIQTLNNFILFGLSHFFVLCTILVYLMFKKQHKYNRLLDLKNRKINSQYLALENSNGQLATTNLKLKESNQELTIVNEDLGRFAYIISHDLKSPLRTVTSFSGLLEQKYGDKLDQEGKNYMRFIVNGVLHMNQLLEDLMTFSRAKRVDLELEQIDLNMAIAQLIRTLDTVIKEKNARFLIGDLPEIRGCKSFILQVFQNIIENALKFVPSDRQPLIQIRSQEKNGVHQISISDNGIGIAPIFKDQIFSIFKRLHSAQEYKGTGVGLAICQTIIERHKGEIWVESDGKNGSTFSFTLPIEDSLKNNAHSKLEVLNPI